MNKYLLLLSLQNIISFKNVFFFFSCIISAFSRFPILFNKGNPLLVGFHNARCPLAVYMVVFRSEFLKGPTGKSRPSLFLLCSQTSSVPFQCFWKTPDSTSILVITCPLLVPDPRLWLPSLTGQAAQGTAAQPVLPTSSADTGLSPYLRKPS